MTKILRWAAALMACAALLACGGGGDAGVKGQPPLGDAPPNPVTNAFSGTFGGQDASGFVLDDGSFWLLYGDSAPGGALAPAGLIYGSAGSGPGLGGIDGQAQFGAYEYTGNGPPATSTALYFNGPDSADPTQLAGSFTRLVEQWPNNQFHGEFLFGAMPQSNYAVQQPTDFSTVIGWWQGFAIGSVPSSIVIDGSGAVSGSANDCAVSGQVSFTPTNYLGFVADLTCATGVRQVHGVIFTYQSGAEANLFLAATASDQSGAFGFMGSRPAAQP